MKFFIVLSTAEFTRPSGFTLRRAIDRTAPETST